VIKAKEVIKAAKKKDCEKKAKKDAVI